jgi:hypothetical protein
LHRKLGERGVELVRILIVGWLVLGLGVLILEVHGDVLDLDETERFLLFAGEFVTLFSGVGVEVELDVDEEGVPVLLVFDEFDTGFIVNIGDDDFQEIS